MAHKIMASWLAGRCWPRLGHPGQARTVYQKSPIKRVLAWAHKKGHVTLRDEWAL